MRRGRRQENHFRILAWRVAWTEEHGGLQSIGSQLDRTEVIQYAHMQEIGITKGFKETFRVHTWVDCHDCGEIKREVHTDDR